MRRSSGAGSAPARPHSRPGGGRRGASIVDSAIVGIPPRPSAALTTSLVHAAATRERRVLLVAARSRRRTDAGTAAPCAASPALCTGRPSSVEADRPLLAQLGHLAQLLALQPARDRRQGKADRECALSRAAGVRAASAAAAAPSRAQGRCSAIASTARVPALPRPRGVPVFQVLLVLLPGRAQGARVDRRTPAAGWRAPPLQQLLLRRVGERPRRTELRPPRRHGRGRSLRAIDARAGGSSTWDVAQAAGRPVRAVRVRAGRAAITLAGRAPQCGAAALPCARAVARAARAPGEQLVEDCHAHNHARLDLAR